LFGVGWESVADSLLQPLKKPRGFSLHGDMAQHFFESVKFCGDALCVPPVRQADSSFR
jgi:hypothetical protein